MIRKKSPHIAIHLLNLNGGGAEKVMLNLADNFIENGYSVDLVLSTVEGQYLNQIPEGVNLINLESPRTRQSIPKLATYLKRESPEALIAALHYPCEVALLAKRLSRVSTRIVVSEHNNLSKEVEGMPQLGIRLKPVAARFLYPWADGIIAVSQGVAKDLAQLAHLPLERIQVIYNPVLIPKLFEQAKKPVNHPWFHSGQPPVILGVGRLQIQKDFPTLIRAFAEVRKQKIARLVILGSGSEKPHLENLIQELDIQEDVDLLGFVENPYSYMANAQVFVLSSIWEGLGNVLIEAMALGTPVVSSDCESGPAEILANGKYGHLVSVGDSQEMAAAILKVLSGDTRNTNAAWLEQFKLSHCAEEYLKVLGFNRS
jgi:glycosyltransferase involved in cell wall biosynthesis